MAFEDLKERLVSELKTNWENFQETSLYNSLKDRYENLTPSSQRLVLYGSIFFVLFVLLSIPYGYYSSSQMYEEEFIAKRELIRELLKTSRDSNAGLDLDDSLNIADVQSRVQANLQNAKLLSEQIQGVSIVQDNSRLIPANLTQGYIEVNLQQLNLRQIIDLGFQMQNLSKTVKLKDLILEANRKDPRYYDAKYKLAVLAVPQPEEAPEKPNPGRGRK